MSKQEIKPKKDTHSYKGWMNSDSFLKRAFGVFGYNMIPALIIYGAMLAVGLVFMVIFSIISAILFSF